MDLIAVLDQSLGDGPAFIARPIRLEASSAAVFTVNDRSSPACEPTGVERISYVDSPAIVKLVVPNQNPGGWMMSVAT